MTRKSYNKSQTKKSIESRRRITENENSFWEYLGNLTWLVTNIKRVPSDAWTDGLTISETKLIKVWPSKNFVVILSLSDLQ